jgi:hypothetical protein
MTAAPRLRIPLLPKLIKALIKVCKVIQASNMLIREFVPDAYKTPYDNAIEAILTACDVIRNIPYGDTDPDTNVPWGAP